MQLTRIVAALRTEGDTQVLDDAPQSWTQGRTLFGGLQAALLVRAMRTHVEPGLPLRTLQTTFVGPVFAGRLAIRCQVLRIGKSAGTSKAGFSKATRWSAPRWPSSGVRAIPG